MLARVASYYINRQVKYGFAAPRFQVEETFVRAIGKCGLDNRFISVLTKFKGFKKREWVQTTQPNPFLVRSK